MRWAAIWGALAIGLSWAGAAAAAPCEDLARAAPADVHVATTAIAPNSGFSADGGRTHVGAGFCRVVGVIESEIGFELWLPDPAQWNGRFMAAGVGGQAGQPNLRELARGVNRGYASASTDAGHKAADTHWLLNRPDRAENYAWRANHLLAERSKALVAAYYARAPEHAFFLGCSGGGRQALTEVQRFPQDFDGVIAGAPGVNTPEMSARRMWEMIQHTRNGGLLSEADWKRIADAAVRACDALDGVRDGVIADPTACRFRIASLGCREHRAAGCLTPAQVAAAERIYAPLRDETGRRIDGGLLPGVPVSPVPAPEPFTPGPAYLAVVLFGDGVHKSATWDPKSFRLASDLPAIDKVMDLHADNPDIAAFRARGGKLILYQGWADPLVAPQPTLDYYRAVVRNAGPAAAKRFVRLFMVPGMGHCVGGDTTDQFGGLGGGAPIPDADHDLLSALEAWVLQDRAPEGVIASKIRGGKVVETRPLCAWPAKARYYGSGDVNDAASFACR